MIGPPPQCLACVHWISPLDRDDANADIDEPTQVCAAFPLPKGIPTDIWANQIDHREPVEGDNDIQFEAEKGMKFPEWALASA